MPEKIPLGESSQINVYIFMNLVSVSECSNITANRQAVNILFMTIECSQSVHSIV